MKVIVTSIVIGTLVTDNTGLVQRLEHFEIKGRVETIQTAALFRSVRILRRVLDT